jgi:hypothetical protein
LVRNSVTAPRQAESVCGQTQLTAIQRQLCSATTYRQPGTDAPANGRSNKMEPTGVAIVEDDDTARRAT